MKKKVKSREMEEKKMRKGDWVWNVHIRKWGRITKLGTTGLIVIKKNGISSDWRRKYCVKKKPCPKKYQCPYCK